MQLDSFNIFLSQQIPKTIRQFNPITNLYNPYTNDINTIHKFKIETYIGASCDDDVNENDEYPDNSIIINDGKRVYIKKPIIQVD